MTTAETRMPFTRRTAAVLAGLVVLAVLAGGCTTRSRSGLPVGRLTIKGVPLEVEIASKGTERHLGFRYRSSIPAGTGMLFIFPEPEYLEFVMDDVPTPLSIAFIGADGAIFQIEDMQPFAKTHTFSTGRARYALEVPQGWFKEKAIGPGDRVENLAELAKRYPPKD